jgi:hypothetical protein
MFAAIDRRRSVQLIDQEAVPIETRDPRVGTANQTFSQRVNFGAIVLRCGSWREK